MHYSYNSIETSEVIHDAMSRWWKLAARNLEPLLTYMLCYYVALALLRQNQIGMLEQMK